MEYLRGKKKGETKIVPCVWKKLESRGNVTIQFEFLFAFCQWHDPAALRLRYTVGTSGELDYERDYNRAEGILALHRPRIYSQRPGEIEVERIIQTHTSVLQVTHGGRIHSYSRRTKGI